ncbi:MAG: hypothetical protein ACRDKU_02300 [Gaiellaceae bacterium]
MPGGPARHLLLACVAIVALLFAPGAAGVPDDPTPPVVTPVIFGTLGLNGWYRSNVTVNWSVVDPESIILSSPGCGATTLSADTPGTQLICEATSDGGTTTVKKIFKLDKTAPTATPAAERAPNASGWYTGPFSVSFFGTDATSGIAGCASARYSGPDTAAASVAGSCSDFAGNVTGAAFSFKYDATAPILSAVTKKLGKRSVHLAWRPSSDIRLVEILRAPGRNGEGQTVVYRGSATTYRDTGLVVARKYRYRVTGFDEAENRSEHTMDITATGALLSPAPGTQVTSPPNLVWTPVKGASYYNVQLMRGRKVLSAWPVRTRFQLRRTWRYNGRLYRLRPGVYRWYVWPGYGRISAARYGRLLGGSTFVVSG